MENRQFSNRSASIFSLSGFSYNMHPLFRVSLSITEVPVCKVILYLSNNFTCGGWSVSRVFGGFKSAQYEWGH